MRGEFEIALIVSLTGGFVTLGLIWIADWMSWQRFLERVDEQAFGDVVELHAEAKMRRAAKRSPGGGKSEPTARRGTQTQTHTHPVSHPGRGRPTA